VNAPLKHPIAAIGDLVEILSGFAFKSERFADAGDLPVIRIRDIKRGYSETFYSGEYDDRYVVSDGDLLVGMDGEFNRARWPGGRALLNQRVCKLSPDSKKLSRHYLYHFLPRALKDIEDRTPFATVKHLSSKDIREIEIPLPSLDEQRRIAAILDKADALRRKRKRAVDLLDGLTQSIFFDLFGHTGDDISRWGAPVPLSDLAEIGSGITKGRKLNGRATRQVPYLAVVNVQDRRLELASVKTIEAAEDEIARYRLRKDDLLLTEGGDPDKLGRGTLWADELIEAIHQNHIFKVRVKSKSVLPLFLNWLVGSPYGKRYFLGVAKQTTGIASINKTQLSQFPTIVPPTDLQHRFVHLARQVAIEARRSIASLNDTESLFSSLQSRAFSGQL
jgi:type I restriction enzyme S subunit